MTDITMNYSPLAIFPEKDFSSFYRNLTKRLGEKLPIKSLGMLNRDEWEQIMPLMEKGDYFALVEMADARNPDPLETVLAIESPEVDGWLCFGKILHNSTSKGIALLQIGKLSDPHIPPPERIVQGSIAKTARLLPVRWSKEHETAEKYNLENLLTSKFDYNYNRAELAFLSILNGVFSQLETHNPNEYSKLFRKNELVIADIGCGMMPYSKMLALYFLNLGKSVKILGIDPYLSEYDNLKNHKEETKKIIPEAKIDFMSVPCSLAVSEPYLKEAGIKNIDLITMFNPDSRGIDIGELPLYLRESALVLTSLDEDYGKWENNILAGRGATRDQVTENFAKNGYMVISENRNPFAGIFQEVLGKKYSPILIAQRIQELLV